MTINNIVHTADMAGAAAGDAHEPRVDLTLTLERPVVAAVVIVNADIRRTH